LECILLHNIFLSATVFSFYIFTFLMFRKLNKPQLTKNKQQNFIGIRAFDSRLYLDISRYFKWIEVFIFRYFKVFQLSQMFTCSLSDLLLLAVGSLVVFVLREYILKVHILVSSEHKLCQTLYIFINYTFSRLLQRTANICCSLQPTIVFFFNILSIVLITKSSFLH
jgi:hypothetical protein